MSNELIGILGVGVGLAALMWRSSQNTGQQIARLSEKVTGISERVARLEGQMSALQSQVTLLMQALVSNGGLVFRTNVKKKQEGEQ